MADQTAREALGRLAAEALGTDFAADFSDGGWSGLMGHEKVALIRAAEAVAVHVREECAALADQRATRRLAEYQEMLAEHQRSGLPASRVAGMEEVLRAKYELRLLAAAIRAGQPAGPTTNLTSGSSRLTSAAGQTAGPIDTKQDSARQQQFSWALAQLRHLFGRMSSGHVKDTAGAARGLLGPAVSALEQLDPWAGQPAGPAKPEGGIPCPCGHLWEQHRVRSAWDPKDYPDKARDELFIYCRAEDDGCDSCDDFYRPTDAGQPAGRVDDGPGVVVVGGRCSVTGNPCGTDTWTVGKPCRCVACREYLAGDERRCTARSADRHCTGPAGHPGDHYDSTTTAGGAWSTTEPEDGPRGEDPDIAKLRAYGTALAAVPPSEHLDTLARTALAAGFRYCAEQAREAATLRAIAEAASKLDALIFIGEEWGVWFKAEAGAGETDRDAALALRAALKAGR